MNYSDEFIINGLVEKLGFNRDEAEQTLMRYDCLGEINDLVSVIEEKDRAMQRLT